MMNSHANQRQSIRPALRARRDISASPSTTPISCCSTQMQNGFLKDHLSAIPHRIKRSPTQQMWLCLTEQKAAIMTCDHSLAWYNRDRSISLFLLAEHSDYTNYSEVRRGEWSPCTTENYDYSSKHTVALWRDCWGFKHSVNENSSFLNRVHWATCQLRVFLGTGISWTQLQCEMCGCRVLCKPDRIPGSTTHFHSTVGCNHTYRWFYSSKQLTETKLELCVLCPPTVSI